MSKEIIEKIIAEMEKKYNNYSENVNNHLHPVPIQDLDYWIVELRKTLKG